MPQRTPIAQKIDPIRLPGTRAATMAPTVANVSESTRNDAPPMPANTSASTGRPGPRARSTALEAAITMQSGNAHGATRLAVTAAPRSIGLRSVRCGATGCGSDGGFIAAPQAA